MKFRPLHDRVVNRLLEGENRTTGSIIIPDIVNKKPEQGEVMEELPTPQDDCLR